MQKVDKGKSGEIFLKMNVLKLEWDIFCIDSDSFFVSILLDKLEVFVLSFTHHCLLYSKRDCGGIFFKCIAVKPLKIFM